MVETGSIEDVVRVMFRQTGAEDVVKSAEDVTKATKKMSNTQKEQVKVQKDMNKATGGGKKGFKDLNFEFLGVMFYGKAVADAFKGMLAPAAEVFGIMDLLSTTLKVMFIPIMAELAPMLIDMMTWFMELDPAIQLVIGGFVVLVATLGTLGFLVGQSVLGFQAIGVALAGAKIGSATALVTKLGAAIAGIAFSPITLALGAAIALWMTDFEGFQSFIKGAFDDVFSSVKSAWGLIVALFEADSDNIEIHANNLAVSISQLLLNTMAWVANASARLMTDAVLTPLRILEWGVKLAGGDISGIRQSIHGMVPKIESTDLSHMLRTPNMNGIDYGGFSPAPNFSPAPDMSQAPMSIVNTYNVNVSDKSEFRKMLEQNSKDMELNLLRQINVGIGR